VGEYRFGSDRKKQWDDAAASSDGLCRREQRGRPIAAEVDAIIPIRADAIATVPDTGR